MCVYCYICTLIRKNDIINVKTTHKHGRFTLMNELPFLKTNSIYVQDIDRLTANDPFVHVDRIAEMNVLIYVISGCIYVTEEDQEYEVKAGELLLLKQGTHQFGQKATPPGTSWYYAHFLTIGGEITLSEADKEGEYITLLPKYVRIDKQFNIEKRLEELVKLKHSERVFSRNILSMGLQMLLIDLYEMLTPPKAMDVADKLKKYLEENNKRNLDSCEIEKKFNLNYKYLAKLFWAKEGVSIMQYHTSYRVYSAARVLRSTDESISQISMEFGYEDPLYFSKVFKKVMGVSPKAYRKQIIQIAYWTGKENG